MFRAKIPQRFLCFIHRMKIIADSINKLFIFFVVVCCNKHVINDIFFSTLNADFLVFQCKIRLEFYSYPKRLTKVLPVSNFRKVLSCTIVKIFLVVANNFVQVLLIAKIMPISVWTNSFNSGVCFFINVKMNLVLCLVLLEIKM